MKKRWVCCFIMLTMMLIPLCTLAQEVPHSSLNVPYLCTFGKESGSDWGDDDYSQTIFFAVSERFANTVYVRIFDPDVGGRIDEIQQNWNTKTRFELYGGVGAYSTPDAIGIEPEGDYKSGSLIAEETYGASQRTDGQWVVFASVDPTQGELVNGYYIFKLIVEGIKGDDGNLYKVNFSASPDAATETTEIEVFAYEWSFRLPNTVGTMIYTFPFIVPKDTKGVMSNIWDFDNDNKIYLNTPTRPGLPVYSTGNNEWAITKYNFSTEDTGGSHKTAGIQKRWSSTSYDVLDEDFDIPWTFQIHKGTFMNNDLVIYVTNTDGKPFPMYSTAQPRSGLAMVMGGKIYEPQFITTEDILFIERDTIVNADITLAMGTVLPKGTRIAKGTKIPQDITVKGGIVIPAGTVLEKDVILEKTLILRDKMILKKGSMLVAGTQIAKGSIVYEGLAPGAGVLPPCNTVLLDTSGSRDPDGNALTFSWDLGDGTQAEGEKIVHTYRKPGSYVVSVIAADDSGAINDAGSKAITVTINSPPVAKAGENQWACAGQTVRFDGTKSYDPDGTVVGYKWTFGDGTSAKGATVSHQYKRPGVYPVRLDVTDDSENGCNTDADGIVVIVNEPPIANAGHDITGCDYTIRFDGTKSFDPDGKIIKYLWYFGDGNAGESARPEHTYFQPGEYTVKLVVSDDSGSQCNTASDEMQVSINAFPVANAGPDRRYCIGEEVYFDGSASSDLNNDNLIYEWNFGDNTKNSKEKAPVHIYKKPGKYTVTLTVTDDSGTSCASSTDTAVITVDTHPVANAGPDQTVDINQSVQFNGSKSIDPNGYPLTYSWTFGDLAAPADGESPTHAYDKPGVYKVILTVSNMANPPCNTDTDEMTVTVNHPPIARAGTSFVTHAGATVTLDGSASFDPDGTIVRYEWDFGDNTPVFKSPNPKATHAFAKPGRYTVTLTVRDNTGLPGGVGTDTVEIIVNFPPVADAGEPGTVCIGQVMFDGTKSTDPDGNIIDYEWDFGDGKTGKGGRPIHIYEFPGVYKVTLTVTDNSGTATNKASDRVTIEINGPPLVNIGKEDQPACPDAATRFDASASSDPNGDPMTITWDFGDGETGTGLQVNHVYKKSGRYIVNATANDGRNMACSETTASKVVVVNEPPVADAGADQQVNPHDKVEFNGSGSVDPDGKIITYMWDFGDGETARGEMVHHVYPGPGEYTVRLTVRDNSDLLCNKASDTLVVKVNAPPVANAGPDQLNLCSRTVEFDGSESRDPDGSITHYEWDFGDGSPVGTGPKPTHTYTKAGAYTVTLKVTDDSKLDSGISTDTMKVVINDPPAAKINAQDIACPGESVKMNAKDSADSDGRITAYEWDFGDGSPTITGRSVIHVYRRSGEYTITLTVRDDSGSACDTGTAKRVIRVNTPPRAVAGDDLITCIRTTDCSVTLDAGKSTDRDGDHLTYHWDFGDGNSRNGIRVQHVYQKAGIYTVTLTVTDNSGTACNTATDTLKVTANAPPDVELKPGE